jgi:hypothetical protein
MEEGKKKNIMKGKKEKERKTSRYNYLITYETPLFGVSEFDCLGTMCLLLNAMS